MELNHMKTLYVSENNHMSKLPPLTDMHKKPQFSLVNQQNVYFFSKHITFQHFLQFIYLNELQHFNTLITFRYHKTEKITRGCR